MNAYSEDLRKKIVEAVEKRGMPKIEAAKTFGVGISSVKRYVATYREGRSLAPKKRPGSKPKLDEGARRLLESDLEERPAATEARVLAHSMRGGGQRLHAQQDAGTHGMEPKKDCEYCDHGARDVSPCWSDPKKRGLRAFPAIRRPVRRASRRRRSESGVTS